MKYTLTQAEKNFLNEIANVFLAKQENERNEDEKRLLLLIQSIQAHDASNTLELGDEKASDPLDHIALRAVEIIRKRGIHTQQDLEGLIKIIELDEFPIDRLRETVDIQQKAWLPKIVSYGFDKLGVCRALGMIWHASKNHRHRFYAFLCILSLAPKDLLKIVKDAELKEFKELTSFLQDYTKYIANMNYESEGKPLGFLNSESFRKKLGINSILDFMPYSSQDTLMHKIGYFFTHEELEELFEIYKIVGINHAPVAFFNVHRMECEIELEQNETTFNYYDANFEHGHKTGKTSKELVAIMAESCKLLHYDVDKYKFFPFGVRGYMQVNNNNNNNKNNNNTNTNTNTNLLTLIDKKALVESTKDRIHHQLNFNPDQHYQSGHIQMTNQFGFSLLYLAVHEGDEELVSYLLKAGADPNASVLGVNPDLTTFITSPLVEAARYGNMTIIKELITYGADIYKGMGVLVAAAIANQFDTVKSLLDNMGNRFRLYEDIVVAICEASRYGYHNIKQYLLERKNKNGDTPLGEVLLEGDFRTAMTLIKLGANLGPVFPEKRTALMEIILLGFKSNFDYYRLLRHLLQTKKDLLNDQDRHGFTALMYAVIVKRVDLVKLLVLQPHIKLDLQNDKGETALIIAARLGQGAIVDCLLGYNVDSTIRDKENNIALSYAHRLGFLTRLALYRHLRLGIRNQSEEEREILQRIMQDPSIQQLLQSQIMPTSVQPIPPSSSHQDLIIQPSKKPKLSSAPSIPITIFQENQRNNQNNQSNVTSETNSNNSASGQSIFTQYKQ